LCKASWLRTKRLDFASARSPGISFALY